MEDKTDFSVLIGGKAGDGIDRAGNIIASVLSRCGFFVYIYRDYPSIIRGGHTFSIVRASSKRLSAHLDSVDFVLALNQDCINLHKNRLKKNTVIVYNSDIVKPDSIPDGIKAIGISLEKIIKEESAPEVMRNTCIVAAFTKVAGIKLQILETVLRKGASKEIELNIKIAGRGYEAVEKSVELKCGPDKSLPIISGNQAISLGLVSAGLDYYVAYPMTPTSGILHILASLAKKLTLKVIHPESEIAVILMALGFSYLGKRVAVGTSGGGFCLMTEGLSLSGMAELPVTVILGQRTGPSTGLPTYTGQTELQFALFAGHGEFIRLIVAPGDAQEAYYWSAVALNISTRCQIPAILLTDKTLSEGEYNFDIDGIKNVENESPELWNRKSEFKRYFVNEGGISPIALVPDKDATVKVNSYEHDEYGITTELAEQTRIMQDKRMRKQKIILEMLLKHETVGVYANAASKTALLCWGSNKGVCVEVADNLGLKVVQPRVLAPVPVEKLKNALIGVDKVILVENSYTGQLEQLLKPYGINVSAKILKSDGRPFTVNELEEKVRGVING